MQERVPAQNIEAEQAVLSAILIDNIVPTSANALYHARIVVNNALLRQLGESGAAITALSFEKEEDIQSLIDRAEQTLHSVSLRKHGKAFVPIHDILTHTMDRMTSLQANGETVTGLSTGFSDLDRRTTGLHPSDFIINHYKGILKFAQNY